MPGGRIQITWDLNVVDRGAGRRILAQDRQIRTGLKQTEQQYQRTGREATSVSTRQVSSASRVARATRSEGTAAKVSASDYRDLSRAQQQTLSMGSRIVTTVNRQTEAYKRQSRVIKEQSVTQRAAAATGRGASAAAGVAGGVLSRAAGLAATAGVGFGLASAAKDAVGFEQTMANVQARLLTTQKNMSRLSDFAVDLGAKTQFSAQQAGDAMDELAAQGFSVNQIFKVLPGTLSLAAASGTDLANAASIQTEALHGFGLAADQANHVADVLAQTANKSAVDIDDLATSIKYIAPVAHSFNQTMEDMMASVGLLGNVGIKGDQAGTTIRRSLVQLVKPAAKTVNLLNDLGISTREWGTITTKANGDMRALPDILGRLSSATEGLAKPDKRRLFAQIFGVEALPGILALMDKGKGKIDALSHSLTNSQGAAKRAAGIMRNTVAGAWDNFTGSVETASIKLTRTFMPAVKGALNAAAGGVNKAVAAVPQVAEGLGAGFTGKSLQPTVRTTRDAMGKTVRQEVEPSKLAKIGEQVGKVARTIGDAAVDAGRMLIDALKPAMPFLQNVLLPLLKGIGEGILISIVGAFKVAIPIIKVVATVLGQLGTWAAPLKGIFEKIGIVVGVVFAGPLLKAIGLLGKLGGAFKILRPVTAVLAAPIRLLGSLFTGLIGIVGKVVGAFGRVTAVGGIVRGAFTKVVGVIRSAGGLIVTAAKFVINRWLDVYVRLPIRLGSYAIKGGEAVVNGIRSVGGKVVTAAKGAVSKVVSPFTDLAHKIAEAIRSKLGDLVSFFGRVGKAIVQAIVDGIKSAPGAIKDAVGSVLGSGLNIAGKALPWNWRRRGGRIDPRRRYADGGMVMSAVSPGEQVLYGGQSWTVPGTPTAADSVIAPLPVGAAVLTWSGQQMMAGGASLNTALAYQMPHFANGGTVLSPGQMATLAYQHGVRPKNEAIRMGAIAMRESHGRPWVHNYDPPRDDSWGLWQINVLPQANPRFKSWHLTDPNVNAKAMSILHKAAGEAPWGGYPESSFSGYLAAARRGFGKGTTGAGITVPLMSRASTTRGGAVEDALSQGISAGEAGLTRAEIARSLRGARGARANPIIGAIRDAQQATTKRETIDSVKSSRKSAGSTAAGVSSPTASWNPSHKPIANWIVPIVRWAAGHGWRGSVTSGYRTNAEQMAAATNYGLEHYGPGGPLASNHTKQKYPGGAIDVSDPAGLNSVLRRYPRKPNLVWGGPVINDTVHFSATGHRRGGRVQRFRNGGIAGAIGRAASTNTLAGGVSAALTNRGGTLDALDAIIGKATLQKLDALYRQLTKQARAGGSTATVQRLQQILSLIDFEVGRRIGILNRAITQRSSAVDRGVTQIGLSQRVSGTAGTVAANQQLIAWQNRAVLPNLRANVRDAQRAVKIAQRTGNQEAIDAAAEQLASAQDAVTTAVADRVDMTATLIQSIADKTADSIADARSALDRRMRKAGIDPTSSAGLTMTAAQDDADVASRQALVDDLTKRLAGARSGGARTAIETQLKQASTDLDEALTVQIEDRRAIIKQAAQDAVDKSQFSVDVVNSALDALDISQRLRRTTDTAQGMAEKARAMQAQLLPALQANYSALQAQYQAAVGASDPNASSIYTQMLGAGNAIGSAMADIAELMRQAAEKAAQDLVDAATHETTMRNLALQNLELQQRIAGTYEGGAQQRADFITQQVIPALQAELNALQNQQAVAQQQGDAELARQIAEAIAQKQNDILQSTLDATEEIADNTSQRRYGGTAGFTYGNENLTDAIIGVGNGS